jgi:integrase
MISCRRRCDLRSWRKVNEMVYRLAGVAKAHNHDYRRTFASHTLLLTQHGEPIAPTTVMRWIGHASLDLTINVYARDLPNEWHANRGSSLDFAVARYQDMPGFAEKLAACDTCDMRDTASQPE